MDRKKSNNNTATFKQDLRNPFHCQEKEIRLFWTRNVITGISPYTGCYKTSCKNK